MTNIKPVSQASSSLVTSRPKIPRASVRFTPYAWAKLCFMRDSLDTEIGGFGICDADDPLLIEDIAILPQEVTCASVEFDGEAICDFLEVQLDAGREPYQVSRVWIHTHPQGVRSPSSQDEETFSESFGGSGWAVMLILPRGTDTPWCCLQYNGQIPHRIEGIEVKVDFSGEFEGSDQALWEAEINENVVEAALLPVTVGEDSPDPLHGGVYFQDEDDFDAWERRMDRARDVRAAADDCPDFNAMDDDEIRDWCNENGFTIDGEFVDDDEIIDGDPDPYSWREDDLA